MPSTTLWKLRRLAPRALRVLARRKSQSAALASYEATLKPAAETYITAYDRQAKYQSTYRTEMAEGKNAAAKVLGLMRQWLPVVQTAMPGFDASTFGDRPMVPDDIIEDGARLYDMVNDYVDANQQPLSFKAACLAELEPAIKLAQKEWGEAEAADKTWQELIEKVRVTGIEFDRHLQVFRRTLASASGRSDKDFQKLRAEKAQAVDEEDDPNAPPPPAPLTPSTPTNPS